MKIKYFKENQKFFNWLNKKKDSINVIYVKSDKDNIKVKYKQISQN